MLFYIGITTIKRHKRDCIINNKFVIKVLFVIKFVIVEIKEHMNNNSSVQHMRRIIT